MKNNTTDPPPFFPAWAPFRCRRRDALCGNHLSLGTFHNYKVNLCWNTQICREPWFDGSHKIQPFPPLVTAKSLAQSCAKHANSAPSVFTWTATGNSTREEASVLRHTHVMNTSEQQIINGCPQTTWLFSFPRSHHPSGTHTLIFSVPKLLAHSLTRWHHFMGCGIVDEPVLTSRCAVIGGNASLAVLLCLDTFHFNWYSVFNQISQRQFNRA